uniref:Variant surface glycoprotein n=1 Tax=Trypanosoma brucei TaxID=5691 RepID=A0A1V0FYI8_9TRYP|nr:variant surface glycoprotein [Trypanosoma brucei]
MWLVISDEQGSQTSHALHELYNAVEAYKPETTPCWPFNKKSDQDFRADVQQTLLGTEPTKEGEGDKVSAINSMIDNTYGTDIQTFNDKFWNSITGTNVAKSRRDTASKTEIKSAMTAIAAVDMLGTTRAVSCGARKKAAAVAKDTLKSQDKKSGWKTKNKDQCKTDNGYELKGEHCVEKYVFKVEGTGVTNTTASNSFVINKASL